MFPHLRQRRTDLNFGVDFGLISSAKSELYACYSSKPVCASE